MSKKKYGSNSHRLLGEIIDQRFPGVREAIDFLTKEERDYADTLNPLELYRFVNRKTFLKKIPKPTDKMFDYY